MVKIRSLTFKYGNSDRNALDNINLSINKGEFMGITGPAGAGKSTLALCLNGVIPHFHSGDFYGEIIVDGKDTVDTGCASLACSIGSVFQDPESQIVAPVVEEEIAFGLENLNMPKAEMEKRIAESLALTGISHLRSSSTARLSGGQKQRVAIAAAIALKPKLLVLDEPTSELDPQGSREVFETLARLNVEHGITIIVIEQKMQLLCEYCSRLVVLDKGRIVLDDASRKVLAQQDLLEKLGVNSPPVSRLAYLLKQEGLYAGELPVNEDEAYLIVSKVLSGRSRV